MIIQIMDKKVKHPPSHPSLEGYLSSEPEIEGYRLERVFLNKDDGLDALAIELWVPIKKAA